MNKTLQIMARNLSRFKGKTLTALSAYSPEILTGVGIAGLIATVALTAKAAVKIDHILAEAEAKKGEPLTVKEIVKETWKEATPVILSTAATGACIFASHQVSTKRRAALMAAYAMAEENLEVYKKQVKEIVGEEKEEEIRQNVAKTHLSDTDGTIVEETGKGSTLCYDKMSGRYFRSSKNRIEAAVNSVNQIIISDWSAVLNDFYNELGLDPIYLGDDLGWNSNNMLSVAFDTAIREGGDVVLVLDYKAYPEYRLL